MAELMLLSEIADPTRFFTDNLLGPEDWGAWRAAWGRERAAAGGTPAHAARKRAPRGKAGPIRNPPSEGGRSRAPVVLRGAGAGETSARCRGVELFRGRGGGAAARRHRLSGGRAVGLAGGPNEGWTRAVRRCPRPAPPAPTPRLLQTARCTPAWTRWPRSRPSSSAAPSRMSRYCSQLPVPPWAGGSGPRARTPPQPFFLTAPPPNTLPHSVRQQHAGCGDGCQPPRASMGPPAPLSR